jgi:putative membrane protein
MIFVYCIIFLISFFPAKFWYMPERSWVGFATTIGFALACYIPLWKLYRWRWMITLGIIWLFWYIIESVWVLTCYPYGCFSYSEQLWPKIFGIVPYMLFFTRPPLVFAVWSWIKDIRLWIISKSLLGWIVLMSVDLILDPIAVHMWLWNYPGWWFWFGVPLSNFLWWLLSGSICTAIAIRILVWILPNYNKRLDYGLWLTMIFFVGYMFRYQIMFYFY